MLKRRFSLLILVIMMLLSVSCSGDEPIPPTTPQVAASATSTTVPPSASASATPTAKVTASATSTTVPPSATAKVVASATSTATPQSATSTATSVSSEEAEAGTSDTQEVPTASQSGADEGARLAVGSKGYTEQLLLGKMLVLMLREAGYEVEDKTGLGDTPIVREALESGEIDLYWEYTGTALSVIHDIPVQGLPTNPQRGFALAKSLDQPLGLVWLEAANFNDTYTLMVQESTVDQGITSIEELADFMNANDAPLKICVESIFYSRADGLPNLQKHYGFEFQEENVLLMELVQTYEGLRDGECEVAEGYSTDGRISAWGFANLVDSQAFFPAYNPAPIIRQDALDAHPELGPLLAQIGPQLDEQTMTELNARVALGADGTPSSGDEESAEEVAKEFLAKAGLLGERPQLAVGSKGFTEQLLLGKMLVLMLQEAGYEVEDKTGLGDTPIVREALETGEIDLYWEYTGTALSIIHEITVEGLPTDPKRAFALIQDIDQESGIVWLEPANFNDTYTLMVQQGTVDEGITTIEELASFMNANDAPLKLCVESIFYSRADGLPNLQEYYGFSFKEENVLLMELTQTYEGLRDGTCDVAEGYSTDGRISAWGFANLIDSQGFFPAYNPAPTIRQEVLDAYPELEPLLAQIGPHLDEKTITLLNAQVDVGADGIPNSGDEQSVEQVAQEFLEGAGLLGYRATLPESNLQAEVEAPSSSCENIIVNGGFESDTGGALSLSKGWDLAGALAPIYSSEQVYQGNLAIKLGHSEENEFGHSALNQNLTLPADATSATLSFWYYPISLDLVGGDVQGLLIYDDSFTFARQRPWWEIENQQTWQQQTHDLTAFLGEEINLHFLVINDDDVVPSSVFLDDVKLEICYTSE